MFEEDPEEEEDDLEEEWNGYEVSDEAPDADAWIHKIHRASVEHQFNLCDWCEQIYPNDVPFYVISLRTSMGDGWSWVCQMCLDEKYSSGAVRMQDYLDDLKRAAQALEDEEQKDGGTGLVRGDDEGAESCGRSKERGESST